VNWIVRGLPGAGHLLVFNNGNARDFSSADEIVTPVDERGSYVRSQGTKFGPETAIWSYGEQAQPHFLSPIFGGAQRLPNGNTLICISTVFRTIEVTPESEVVWETNIQDLAGPNGSGTFRASRFPPNYEGLRNTDLFREGPTLVNAASMIGGPSAPGGMVEAQGTGLPSALAGTTVDVTDASGSKLPAPLISVSPDEVYFQLPAASAIGPARITIRGNETTDQSAEIRIDPAAPGLFSANGDGQGVGAIAAVHVSPRGQSTELVFSLDPVSRRFVLKPFSLGSADEQVLLQLFGTGMRGAPGALTVLIGGVSIPVVSSGPQSLLLGLDEVVIGPLPRILAGRGVQPISIAIDSAASNSVSIWFQ
jgi:uncharacterized protein (TIGR03437 family)